MDDGVDTYPPELLGKPGGVEEIALEKLSGRVDGLTMTVHEVVQGDDVVASFEQTLSNNAADIAGGSSDQYLHGSCAATFCKIPLRATGVPESKPREPNVFAAVQWLFAACTVVV